MPAGTSSYEEIPYPRFSFALTHPRRLRAIAHLFGLETAPIRRCRVLEIGCASGGNLIPIAYSLPEAHCLGFDVSPGQIEMAKAFARGAGVENVELHVASLANLPLEWGQFDYIIAHGVFSWVSTELADQLLHLCGRRLTDGGVAYISLNTYPGWHVREWIRNAMLFQARDIADPKQRIETARQFIATLVESPFVWSAMQPVLRGEAEYLKKQPDAFIAHDHMEADNHPVYFRDFAARAAAGGLQYIADATQNLGPEALWPPALQWMQANSHDLIAAEQYGDFVNGRSFRSAVLCKSGVALDRGAMAARFAKMHAQGYLRRTDQNDGATRFDLPGLNFQFTTKIPAVRAALSRLIERYPACVAVEQLLGGGAAADIFPALMYCWCSGRIVLYVDPPPLPRIEPGDFPRASRICRYLVSQNLPAINLRQETVNLSAQAARLAPLLDGTRRRNELPEASGLSAGAVERALKECAQAGVLEA